MNIFSEWLEKRQSWNRARKVKMFLELFRPSATDTLLDVGPTDAERHPSSNILEKTYPYPHNITALGMSAYENFSRLYPSVKVVQYDGGAFPFADNAFDICWCSAVLEHVGDEDRQIRFLQEIRRVSRRAYVTTPNRYFPLELHTRLLFLHYLPKPAFDRILRAMGRGWASGDYMHLLSRGDLRRRLMKSGISNARIWGNRWCGLTVDFNVMMEQEASRRI